MSVVCLKELPFRKLLSIVHREMLLALLHPVASVVARRAVASAFAVIFEDFLKRLRAVARDDCGPSHGLWRRRRFQVCLLVHTMAFGVIDERLLLDESLLPTHCRHLQTKWDPINASFIEFQTTPLPQALSRSTDLSTSHLAFAKFNRCYLRHSAPFAPNGNCHRIECILKCSQFEPGESQAPPNVDSSAGTQKQNEKKRKRRATQKN